MPIFPIKATFLKDWALGALQAWEAVVPTPSAVEEKPAPY
jgi:hypothetical protein